MTVLIGECRGELASAPGVVTQTIAYILALSGSFTNANKELSTT